MTFAATGSLISASAASFSLTPAGTGNLILLAVLNTGPGLTSYATAVSSSNVTWAPFGQPYTGASAGGTAAMFAGTVTGTGAATVTVTFSGSTGTVTIGGQEFTTALGAWLFHAQGQVDTAAGTNSWAPLAPFADGELYFGCAYDPGTASPGGTAGFTYATGAGGHAAVAWNAASPATARFPVWGDSGQVLGIMALAREAQSVSGFSATLGGYDYPLITDSSIFTTRLNNNVWNPQAGTTHVLTGADPGLWSVTASVPDTSGGAVVSYPDIEQEFSNIPLRDFSSIVSSYTETMNATANTMAEAAYDIWLNDFGFEVMIWTDTTASQAATLGFDTLLAGSVTIGGLLFDVYKGGGATEWIYYLKTNMPSGTVDVLAVLRHAERNYLGECTLRALEFGWEIASTHGVTETFVMSSYSLLTGMAPSYQADRAVPAQRAVRVPYRAGRR